MSSLIDKNTFDVCPVPHGRKVIPTKLVLKIKIGSDGRIDKFKARSAYSASVKPKVSTSTRITCTHQ